jgi:alpha-glucosidase (family GH31 glycosyl hydrolase)
MQAFMKHAHQESDKMGVAFWWLDWQQDYVYPTVRGTTTKHLPWLNEVYYNYSQQNNRRGTGFSRWAGWGDHRHPIQFSGDSDGNWNLLKFEIDLTTTSGNAGCFFWAHDLGGFSGGKDPELYTRWTQFGLLNSSLRIHSVYDKDLDRRPWLWGAEAEAAMHRIYHLRSQLMPYIYSSVRECNTDMLPLNRALYIEHPLADQSYKHPGEFYFGDLLLAAPVTEAGTGTDKVVTSKVWLPEGDSWYHFFQGTRYEGNQEIEVQSPLDEFPLFVKGGYLLPMQPYTPRMASTPLTELILRCYPGEAGSDHTYSLYEDDGLTLDYQQGGFATTALRYQRTAQTTILRIGAAQGSYQGQVLKRSYRIELYGIEGKTSAKVNGKKVPISYETESGCSVVYIPATDIRQPIEISI